MEPKESFFKNWIQGTATLVVVAFMLWIVGLILIRVGTTIHSFIVSFTTGHWPHSLVAGWWLSLMMLTALLLGVAYATVRSAAHTINKKNMPKKFEFQGTQGVDDE